MDIEKYIEKVLDYVHKKKWKPYSAYYIIKDKFPTQLEQKHFSILCEEFGYDEYWAIMQYEQYSGKRSPIRKEYAAKKLDEEILQDTDFTGDWFKWEEKGGDDKDIKLPF